ncbi:ABC transporter substrate-binding protein [Frankia canadensis]|nr:ABC transporter substrate-binding protein [Frankia canadensis]
MVISTLQSAAFGFPEAVDGAKAAAAKINAAGGVNGRQIEIQSCNDQFDPNTAVACAQKAVSQKVSGVLTGYTSYGSKIVPVLAAAKIPFLGALPATEVEWNSPVSFPFSPGTNGLFAALSTKLYEQKCTKMALLSNTAGASIDTSHAAETAFKQAGGEVVYKATIPPTAADVAPQVVALLKAGAKCVVSVIPPAVQLNFIKAAYAADPTLPIGLGGLDDEVVAKLGPAGQNLVRAEASYPAASDQMKPFVAALHAFNPAAVVSAWSLNTYSGVEAIAEAAKGLDKTDGASLIAALDKTSVTLSGYPKPIDFTKPLAIKGWSRLFNSEVVVSHFQGDHFVAYPGTVDSLAALQATRGGA